MSKEKARGPQSYKNEELLLALLPEVLHAKGFDDGATRRQGGMKFLDAAGIKGEAVRSEDGVLVRAGLHRLLDRGLAEIKGGTFVVAAAARSGEHAQFHNRVVPLG